MLKHFPLPILSLSNLQYDYSAMHHSVLKDASLSLSSKVDVCIEQAA